ncbi:MAG TPA: methylglyoxal synthase [Arachidicoccus soli]|uniref:Methylglyoxal synthase n=1 Tax=Arachidicoccus soli TaxID=2341117 RepID=A0A386HLX1_9BACT|nr:methylglyoxal synthase [Arachidicoccus soli]AYD46662.1 methylglyoxal synthase [Arachidicoccus soli]HEU0226424.1 methylglyoxal synthase [Arachidicoccus soli]
MKSYKELKAKKNIALVAHDHKKDDLIDWISAHKDELIKHNLIATGTTGARIEEKIGVPVQRVMSGPLGGDQQMGAMIATGQIDMVIFFWDPMEAQPHDSDVKALLRLGVVWNIPMACCPATADFILSSPYMQQSYSTEVTDYSGYLNRKITS